MENVKTIEVVEVEIPDIKQSAGSLIGSIIGIIIAITGVIMMLSIILILPGIGAVLIGLVMAVKFAPKAIVNCPACGVENKPPIKSKQLVCEGCGTKTPLKWKKPQAE